MAEEIGPELAASYAVTISGIQRTKAELARLDGAIKSLRAAKYSPSTGASAITASAAGGLFVTKLDDLEGRIQTTVQSAMLDAMDLGKEVQADALRAAVTPTGESGKSHVGGRNGPGRDDSGETIRSIKRNVETFKTAGTTVVAGWHGWDADSNGGVPDFQERGTRGRSATAATGEIKRRATKKGGVKRSNHPGVPAANSLGKSIPTVREALKRDLGRLKK